MKTLNILGSNQISNILGIVLLVVIALGGWNYVEDKKRVNDNRIIYKTLLQENKKLRDQIENLTEQNKLLIRVLEIKQDNE